MELIKWKYQEQVNNLGVVVFVNCSYQFDHPIIGKRRCVGKFLSGVSLFAGTLDLIVTVLRGFSNFIIVRI